MNKGRTGAPAGLYDPSKLTAAARSRIVSTRERATSLKSSLSFSSFPKDDLLPHKKKQEEDPAVGEKYTFCKTQVFPDERWRESPGHHAPPENELELEWVYGYHGHDGYAWLHNDHSPETRMAPSRNNLFFVANEGGVVDGMKIAYFTSSIGVVMDIEERKQKFFIFHDGEICSMAVNAQRTLVATGQVSSHGSMNPSVAVWSPMKVFSSSSSSSCVPEAVMSGFCEFRIVALSFSADGQYIMCIGDDELHRFACYRWQDDPPSVLFKGQVGKATILHMAPTVCGFAACGNKEIKVWEHPMLNSQFSKDVEGVRWLVGVRPMEESMVECIAVVPDPDSACGSSLVCGWPDGHLCFFQQKEEAGDWNLEFVGNRSAKIAAGRGSRYWMGHAGRAVKCVSYLHPDALAESMGCHKGLLVSSDVEGHICGWKVDPSKPIDRGSRKKMLRDFAWEKMFEANLADVVDQLVARGWKANAAKSAVDVCPVPLNPNVLLPLYASRLDYDGHGSLLVGLSNNKIVRLPMQPLVASGKLRPQVLVDGHTGYLRAVASLPTASLYFNLGVRMFGEEHVHVVGDGSSGQEIAEVVMKVFPFMESREVARDSVMEGNVVVMRPDPHGELKIFDPLVNDFREMENEEKSAIFRQDSQEVEPFEYMIADRSFQTPEVRIEKMEERNLPSRSSVVIKEMNTFDLDDARLPNARYAKQTGLVQVQVRSIQHDRDPIWSSTRKLQRLTGKNKSEKSVVGCCVQSGDVLVYRGALNTRMQTKLKQVISTITHTSTRHIVLHDVQPFLVEDEEGVHVTYNMLLRLRVPSNEHDCVVERIRRSMRERPNYWKMVREAFAIKNRALTKSPHITQHVAQCDFDKLMKEEGIPAEAQLLGRSFWRRREEQTSVLFSCGEDGTLCKWDPYQHVLLDSIYLPGFTGKDQRQWRRRATCMAVSPPRFGADRWVAVGHRMGTISILDAQDLSSLMVEIQDRSSDVRDIKFSSTGCMMAVGSSEGLIDLYSIQDAAGEDAVVVAWLAVCRGHTASVTHLDFSVDSRFLRSNDAGGEILYWHLVDENSPGQTLHFLQQQRDGIVRLLSKNLSHPAGKLRVRPAGIGRYSGAVNSRLLQHGHAAAGTMVKETSRLSSLDWSSSSCKLCWHLRSIWRPRSKLHHIEQVSVSYLEDVVACAYAPDFIRIGNFPDPFLGKEQAVTRFKAFAWRCLGSSTVNIEEEATKSFSVRADSKGVFSSSLLDRFTVKLFRFPCVGVPSSPFLRSCYLAGSSGVPGSGPSTMPAWYEAYPRSFSGHAGAVTAAEWAGEDLWLLTAGGADCSLLQWRHRRPLWKRWWLRRSRRQQQTLRQLFGKTVPRVTTELQGKEEGENIFEQLVSRACKDVGYLTGEEEVAKEKILDAMPKLMLLWSQFPEQAVELAFSSSSSSSITTCCMQEFTCAVAEEHVGHVAATFFDAVKEREGEEAVTCRVDELEEALSRKEGKKFLREMMQRDLPLPHLDQSCRCLQDVLRLVGGEEQEERSGKGMCSRRRFVSAMVTLQIKHTPSIKLQ